MEREEIYTILDFIDSPEIRKHNETTVFTPAQQAVLIMRSRQRSMEEKLDALQHLVDAFTEEEFCGANIFWADNEAVPDGRMREITIKNIEYYRRLLEKRYVSEDCVFAVAVFERDMGREYKDCMCEYCFQTDFEGAFQKLQEGKAYYENKSDLRDVALCGEIVRISLKEEREESGPGRICYRYNHNLKLVEVEKKLVLDDHGWLVYKIDEIIMEEDEDLDKALGVHISTPFRRGDIVKSVTFNQAPVYGVVHGSEEMDKEWWDWQDGVMGIRLDISWEGGKFGWEHDFPILSLSYCGEEEIPHGDRMIKLLSYLRKGKLDIADTLRWISFGEMDDLLDSLKKAGINMA